MRYEAREQGFTMIELVMVVMLVAILAAVAIPNFINFQTDARNSASHKALGGLRTAISIGASAISMREAPTTLPMPYPTVSELIGNTYLAGSPSNHPVLAGTKIMDSVYQVPVNPWTKTNTVHDCTGMVIGALLSSPANDGWCYNPTSGKIWANSSVNGQPVTENSF